MLLAESRFQTRKIRGSDIAQSRADERQDRGIQDWRFDRRMPRGQREVVERYMRREGKVVGMKGVEGRNRQQVLLQILVPPPLSHWAPLPPLLEQLVIGRLRQGS